MLGVEGALLPVVDDPVVVTMAIANEMQHFVIPEKVFLEIGGHTMIVTLPPPAKVVT
jgi:hypothetical protein